MEPNVKENNAYSPYSLCRSWKTNMHQGLEQHFNNKKDGGASDN